VAGQNTLTLNTISGSGSIGPYLNPGCAFDAVELDIPNSSPATPPAPTGLASTAVNGAQIHLAWVDNSTNEVNFLIERSSDNVVFTLIAAVTAGVTNYADSGLAPGALWYYRVRAANSGGYSAYSNSASARTTLPQITGVNLSGPNILLSGVGGIPNAAYYVLASTNLNLPFDQWPRIATNQFDASGNFVCTNALGSGTARRFYLVQLP
jgi:hypothetical protein